MLGRTNSNANYARIITSRIFPKDTEFGFAHGQRPSQLEIPNSNWFRIPKLKCFRVYSSEKSQNIYGWMEWIISEGKPFNKRGTHFSPYIYEILGYRYQRSLEKYQGATRKVWAHRRRMD